MIVLASPEALRKQDIILVVACSTHPRKQDVPRFAVPSRYEAKKRGFRWNVRMTP